MCALSHPTLYDPIDCSLPGSSVHEIFQARILEWVAISYSRGSSWPKDQTHISCISCISRRILYHWAIWEAPFFVSEDARIWGLRNHSFERNMCWNYLGLVPFVFTSGVSSGLTVGSGCSLMAARWQVFFPSWVLSGLTSLFWSSAIAHDCDILVYWYGRKHFISQSLESFILFYKMIVVPSLRTIWSTDLLLFMLQIFIFLLKGGPKTMGDITRRVLPEKWRNGNVFPQWLKEKQQIPHFMGPGSQGAGRLV